MSPEPVLIARSVHKSFTQGSKTIAVLTGAHLEVFTGERVAIVGLSGSGKSTLLHILGGLEVADKGEIIIGGKSLISLRESEVDMLRNRSLGFVYQFHHLLSDFSAVENVAMPLLIRGKSRTDALAKAGSLLDQVGLSERLKHKPGQLSGGERQRVAIARALVGDPLCVMADEPTGNLDEKTADDVNSLIMSLSSELQTSFVIVTHNHDLANRMDRIVTLHNGVLNKPDTGTE